MAETKLKPQSLDTEVNFGWQLVSESWAYASATTITVPTDATTRFQKGDKLRIKQGAGYKYYYIVGVAATTLTVTGGTDYTVANAGITDIYISRASNPFGFPQWFAYTPTWTGSGSNPAIVDGTITGKFVVTGKVCQYQISIACGASTTYGTGNYSYGLPITPSSTLVGRFLQHVYTQHSGTGYVSQGAILSNSAVLTNMASTGASSTYGVFNTTTPFTWANGDLFFASGYYEI